MVIKVTRGLGIWLFSFSKILASFFEDFGAALKSNEWIWIGTLVGGWLFLGIWKCGLKSDKRPLGLQ